MEPKAYSEFLAKMKGYEQFLRDNLADGFADPARAGEVYRQVIDARADPGFASRLFQGLEGGSFSPRLESFSSVERGRSFVGFRFYDNAGNEATYVFEQRSGGTLRPLGELWDVDQGRGLTYTNLEEANRGVYDAISKGQWDGIRNEVLRGAEALDKAEPLFGAGAKVVRLANTMRGTFDYAFRIGEGAFRGALEAGEHSIMKLGGKLARGLRGGVEIDWANGEFRVFGDDIDGFGGRLSRSQAAEFVDGFEEWARANEQYANDLGIHTYAETEGGTTTIWLENTLTGVKIPISINLFPPL